MKNLLSDLAKLFDRDLERLHKELDLTPDELLWQVSGQINNSPGNLFLHISGNLQHFIGAILGQSGYVRDREGEFGKKGLPKADLAKDIESAKTVIQQTLEKMKPAELDEIYPLEVFGYPMTTGYFLIHLNSHLNYHYGQINYFRRILALQ